ncbi:MAG: glycosyltransferase family 4 protein [Actinomycetota bacterium]
MTRLIFQLGTNNWQREGEFAPGSGILHEAHHLAFNSLPETAAYSIYPSRMQRFREPRVRVFELEHDIPICESISPVSNHRWHSMSDSEVRAYRRRLVDVVDTWIREIEDHHGEMMSLAIAHHTFLNPVVLADVNSRRVATDRPRIPVLCFAHGTALKMFAAESSRANPEEFPDRFGPMVRAEGVFDAHGVRAVDWVAAISTAQVAAFQDQFPEFPVERIVLSPNGYNQEIFSPAVHPARVKPWRANVLPKFTTQPYSGSAVPPVQVPGDYANYVVFCGKFAEWKRLDALLHAAAGWEHDDSTNIATIIVGSGPHEDQVKYQDLANHDLRLEHTYFVGPRNQTELATLFTAADVACFPSRNEPFGLVFIEAMACGTPVIGANSGGPRDFVNDSIGLLVLESDDTYVVGARLEKAVRRAVADEWKRMRGPTAMRYSLANFSVRSQVESLLSQLVFADSVESAREHELV